MSDTVGKDRQTVADAEADTFYGDDQDDFNPGNVDVGESVPAQNTRSKTGPLGGDEKPLSETVSKDEAETYHGRQGFASMDKERVSEISKMASKDTAPAEVVDKERGLRE
ncbi:hypothetical protein HK097_001817 [Rhizophlyctis rosea]|uniref:Uncharacterized protein n=1 Tax=Rhizophlyctis rosea TaxID=64517 RepID=A0AAD5S508_9FUNG|nr:hypothetical protein HK097_001817 [Rhizophlyctis rosea]